MYYEKILYHPIVVSKIMVSQEIPTVEDIRAALAQEGKSYQTAPEPVFKIENVSLQKENQALKIRIYFPNDNKNQRVIFNIHGGALVGGDLDTHDNISRLLCNKTKSIVVALDYRKPPESPFPASLNDCADVLDWIKSNIKKWGGNANDIVIVGDSAGGLLATALTVKLQKKLDVKALVLINPAVDLRNPGNDVYKLVTMWYLNGQDPTNPLISPILANSFSYFPPTLIVTCQNDELKPHGDALFEKLTVAKIKTKRVEIENEDHLGGLWAAGHSRAQKAIDETVAFVSTF